LAAGSFAGAELALASDPVGVYAVVDKVVFEPNETAPERIQIWGTFSLAKPKSGGDQYEQPQTGYLYYRLKPDAKSVCEKEWADLKAVAGSHQCVAFAGRYAEKGTIRRNNEEPAHPDEYPIAQGILRVRDANYPPVKRVLEAAEAKPAAKNVDHPRTCHGPPVDG
jgi:hypothetical protein